MISSNIANAAWALLSTLGERSMAEIPAGAERPPSSSPVSAQEAGPAPAPTASEPAWTFGAFVYYWSASVTGNLTVDGQEVDFEGGGGGGFSGETSLSGFLGHLEARRGPWSFALAPIFVSVDAEGAQSGGVDADVEIDAQIHEGFAAYELGRSFDCLAGARYYRLDTDLDLSVGGVPTGSFGNDHGWIDPIIGLRYHGELGKRWSLHGRADVGGFGVGSDFAWNASALVGYRLGSSCAAELGYRVLSVDFAEGSGSDRLAYDLTMSGPIIGVSFSF